MWCGGKLEAQFVNEYGFVGRGTIVLPQGGLIHWGCCLKCFMTSFRRGLLIVLKRGYGVGVLRVLWVVDPVF